MAANTLREAILTALTEKKVYLSENQTRRLEGELRDFFVHEMARVLGPPPRNKTEDEIIRWRMQEIHLASFIHCIFKDVSSYQEQDE